jgi:hypothetical protein
MTGQAQRSENCWRRRLHGEPSIQELLDDPVIEAVMARDGVARPDLEHLIAEARVRLARRTVRELQEMVAS